MKKVKWQVIFSIFVGSFEKDEKIKKNVEVKAYSRILSLKTFFPGLNSFSVANWSVEIKIMDWKSKFISSWKWTLLLVLVHTLNEMMWNELSS